MASLKEKKKWLYIMKAKLKKKIENPYSSPEERAKARAKYAELDAKVKELEARG